MVSCIQSAVREAVRIPMKVLCQKLDIDLADCHFLVAEAKVVDGVELFSGGDFIFRASFIAETRRKITDLIENSEGFQSVFAICQAHKIPIEWALKEVFADLVIWDDFVCSKKVSVLCNSRLNDLLENEIKEPCEDLMKFVVDSLVDFVPRSFVRKFIQEQANYCGHGTFFPVNYIEKIGQEADSFIERNSFLNPSCFSQRIPSSFLQEFAFERGHFYISESSLVLKLEFLDTLRNFLTFHLSKGELNKFGCSLIKFPLCDEAGSILIKHFNLKEYILYSESTFWPRLAAIDALLSKEKISGLPASFCDVISEGEKTLFQSKYNNCYMKLALLGVEKMKLVDCEIASSLLAYFNSNFKCSRKMAIDSFYEAYILMKFRERTMRLVENSSSLPILLHARISLFLHEAFGKCCIFEFSGMLIPSIVSKLGIVLFSEAKDAVLKNESDTVDLVKKLQTVFDLQSSVSLFQDLPIVHSPK